MVSRVKGTQDFLDLRLFNFVTNVIQQQTRIYHFRQIDTPILEHAELFKRSLGLQTDVVSKEMFLVGNQTESDSLCLRPEATAAIMRAFLEYAHECVTPWKVFSIGPLFRYERPQKGRFRQFHQATFEVIGSASVLQDVQLIKMLERLFQDKFNLDTYVLTINFLGCAEDRARFRVLLYDFVSSVQDALCQDCLIRKEHNLMRVLDCKVATCQAQYRKAPHIADNLCAPCQQEWQQVQDELHMLSISFSYSPFLVRGLDYYDKTVFEFSSANLGAQSAFCGGGRYNRLASHIGASQDFPAVGASIGIERLMLLLEPMMNQLPLEQEPPLQIIIPMGTEQQSLALLLADELQAQDLCVDLFVDADSMKSKMKRANKMGAEHVLIIGSNEQAERKVMVKKMVTGTEELVDQSAVASYLKRINFVVFCLFKILRQKTPMVPLDFIFRAYMHHTSSRLCSLVISGARRIK